MVEVGVGADVSWAVGVRQVGESRSTWAGRLGVAVGVGVAVLVADAGELSGA